MNAADDDGPDENEDDPDKTDDDTDENEEIPEFQVCFSQIKISLIPTGKGR